MYFKLLFIIIMAFISVFASAQESADCIGIYDSVGVRVASATSGDGSTLSSFFVQINGIPVELSVIHNEIRGSGRVVFTDTTCSINPFFEQKADNLFISGKGAFIGDTLYYTNPISLNQILTVNSFVQSGTEDCVEEFIPNISGFPAAQTIFPEFTPPFHLEPEFCPQDVIHACVKVISGSLKVVDGPLDCAMNEVPISWLVAAE